MKRIPRKSGMSSGSCKPLLAWPAKKLFDTSIPPFSLESPGMKSLGFVTPLLWQVLQLTPKLRAGSPNISGLSKAISPKAMRKVSASFAPRTAIPRIWRGRGSCLLMLAPGGRRHGTLAVLRYVSLVFGRGRSLYPFPARNPEKFE